MKRVALVALVALVGAACSDDGAVETVPTTLPPAQATSTSQPEVSAPEGSVLSRVLVCGVNAAESRGFSQESAAGDRFGFDVDFCKAVATAIFGRPAVEFVGIPSSPRFAAILSGEVDVMFRTTTANFQRDVAEVAVAFGPPTFFDGQQFLGRAPAFSESSTVADLDLRSVCVGGGTTTLPNVEALELELGIDIEIKVFEDSSAAIDAFDSEGCDAVTGDASKLKAAQKDRQGGETWVLFPLLPISKEPLAPVFREGDDQWRDLVTWVVFSTMSAEEAGLTAEAARELLAQGFDPHTETRDVGVCYGQNVEKLGLAPDAFLNVVAEVGNYGEIYELNLDTVGITRAGSLNASYLNNGLIYSPPCGG